MKLLQERDAVKWTFWQSEKLSDFLHEQPDLPIIAHSVRLIKDKVIEPAFFLVNNVKMLPNNERWRCSRKLAKNIPHIDYQKIQKVIEALGFNPKKNVDGLDAIREAMLCGLAYMELIEMKKNG